MRYLLLLIIMLGLSCGSAYSASAERENKILAETAPILKNLEMMVGQKDYSAALKTAKELLKKTEYTLDPSHRFLGNLYNILCTLYSRQSDDGNAAYYLEKALAVERANAEEPEQISKTIDLLSSLYKKMGKKEEQLRELKILKATVLRPLFAQPLLEKNSHIYTATEIPQSHEKLAANLPPAQIEAPSLSVPPLVMAETQPESQSADIDEKEKTGNGGKILWGAFSVTLALAVFALLRRRKGRYSEPSEKISAETNMAEEALAGKAIEQKAAAEDGVASADERWKQYHERFAERQALIILGVEEPVSWEEINNRYCELMQTYAQKNVEELSVELQKMAELKREKITQAFETLKSRQTLLRV
ncbi:MAG: hypothetical protein HZC17_04760 [Candidatus Omnitrophica bacterium]|nr:hypothetical protein [Candidatus Omnitrophota bacterium]